MMRFISILSMVVVGVACAVAAEQDSTMPASQKSAWTVIGNVPADQFNIQAHRGAGDLAEENTLAAFQLGWKLGCIPESDLRTTSDGVIVAFHDADFSRVVKDVSPEMKTKGVKDITFAELQKLDVGAFKGAEFKGRHVSRMTEVFAMMKGHPERNLYLDIKNVSLPQLAKEVEEYAVGAQVILASTKYAIIRDWKKLVPDGQTLLWLGAPAKAACAEADELLRKRIDEVRKADFADITQLQIHVHFEQGVDAAKADAFRPSDSFLIQMGKEVRAHHILYQSLPQGATDPKIYQKLLDLGVMSFASDRPDITRDAVNDYYAKRAGAAAR